MPGASGEMCGAHGLTARAISFPVSEWTVELEPEVSDWISALPSASFAVVAFNIDRLVKHGASLRAPPSRSLGDGVFELRFDLERTARRITYFHAGSRRIVLLTTFHMQRDNERREVERAKLAKRRCIAETHRVEEDEEQ